MKKLIFFVGLFFPFLLSAQSISGTVKNKKNEPLIGASVFWENTNIGTVTNEFGAFELKTSDVKSKSLVATYTGHRSDTINVGSKTKINFVLSDLNELNDFVLKRQKNGVIISNLESIKTEQINQVELAKAACCDLAGCFSTQTTVKAQTTNVITNSKELRISGLAGVYNQVLIDGFPMIQGLSYTYGISSIPGTIVNNIFVAKGANSVLQGFESISGQINVITIDPANTDKLYLNAYMNSFAEKQFNGNLAFTKGKWSNLSTFHVVQPANEFDRDNDNFLDLPKLTRYRLSNKLKYRKQSEWGWYSTITLNYLDEERIGGQTNFNPESDKGSSNVYGQTVNFSQPEFYSKTGYNLDDMHHFALFVSGFHQNQESYFGTLNYKAKQNSMYSNLQYELKHKNNELKTGISNRYLDLEEDIIFTENSIGRNFDGNYLKEERITGFFAENTHKFLKDKLTLITGFRADKHNTLGWFYTPRALVKYDIGKNTVIRANSGSGWRTINLFSENIGLLVSSRNIEINEALKAEQAINSGINLTQKFTKKYYSGFLSLDYYRTDFQNQIFPDYDTDPQKAIIENFGGESVSNVFQAEVYLNILKRFEFKTGYNFLDVYRVINGKKQLLPFNPKHKVVSTFGYKPSSKKYQIDMNMHWYGKQRLPNTSNNPTEHQRPDFSKSYSVFNAQFTYNFKKYQVYTGCENIFDFRQKRPIISWQDPFSPNFDTSSVWGPVRGREFYLGLRYKIPAKKKV